eukprot:365747-Chlamydomonas_euryale.AAC.4
MLGGKKPHLPGTEQASSHHEFGQRLEGHSGQKNTPILPSLPRRIPSSPQIDVLATQESQQRDLQHLRGKSHTVLNYHESDAQAPSNTT